MSLGMFAVGVVIFAIVAVLLGVAVRSLAEDDFSGMALGIIIMVCLYCTISGTYFLYVAGKI